MVVRFRSGFVSNSSSTSFVISTTTGRKASFDELVLALREHVEAELRQDDLDWAGVNFEDIVASSRHVLRQNESLEPRGTFVTLSDEIDARIHLCAVAERMMRWILRRRAPGNEGGFEWTVYEDHQ